MCWHKSPAMRDAFVAEPTSIGFWLNTLEDGVDGTTGPYRVDKPATLAEARLLFNKTFNIDENVQIPLELQIDGIVKGPIVTEDDWKNVPEDQSIVGTRDLRTRKPGEPENQT